HHEVLPFGGCAVRMVGPKPDVPGILAGHCRKWRAEWRLGNRKTRTSAAKGAVQEVAARKPKGAMESRGGGEPNEPRERSAPAKRRARERAGESEGRSPSGNNARMDTPALEELVTANRILAREGVVDAFGHVSLRHPRHPDRFWLSRARAPECIEADDLMEFMLDGAAIEPAGRKPYAER